LAHFLIKDLTAINTKTIELITKKNVGLNFLSKAITFIIAHKITNITNIKGLMQQKFFTFFI